MPSFRHFVGKYFCINAQILQPHLHERVVFLNFSLFFISLLWSAFSCIRTEYGEIRSVSPYSVRMRENANQHNSEYEHISRSESRTLDGKSKINVALR